MTNKTVTITAEEYTLLKEQAKHLERAYKVWQAAYFNNGLDRVLNLTRFHDLLGLEAGAADWPDDAFVGDEIAA